MNTWVESDKRRLTSFQKTFILGLELNGCRTNTPGQSPPESYPLKITPKDNYPLEITPGGQLPPGKLPREQLSTPSEENDPKNNYPQDNFPLEGFEPSTSWIESEVNITKTNVTNKKSKLMGNMIL